MYDTKIIILIHQKINPNTPERRHSPRRIPRLITLIQRGKELPQKSRIPILQNSLSNGPRQRKEVMDIMDGEAGKRVMSVSM